MTTTRDILLCAINARYIHSAFGLRYLYANLGELQPRAKIIEFVLGKNPRDIAEELLRFHPKIIGIGVYIWNTTLVHELVSILKHIDPGVIIVLGGPEISFETETQPHFRIADYIIQGEADLIFREFCENYLSNSSLPKNKIINGPKPPVEKIQLPYSHYTEEDIAHRVIYVEASRGCPFKCEYCLSSIDLAVRNFPIDSFLTSMEDLLDRKTRSFKFVDRTFNLNLTVSTKILQFFLERIDLGLFLHFEMIPDRLPDELKALIKKFPTGSLQFEIGVQTWNPQVAANVSRRQDYEKMKNNFEFLKNETGVHTHADLIVGLPGETLDSFQKGFDALAECDVDEIQVGILKKLKGAPLARHDQEFMMIYCGSPPFQILKNRDINFAQMQEMGRFAQYWDLYANSGNFKSLIHFFETEGIKKFSNSLFFLFQDFSDYLFSRHHQAHAISQSALAESATQYLMDRFAQEQELAQKIARPTKSEMASTKTATPSRQKKHRN